ncbi:MAG: U32 family peptidase [Lachnospiraceae bacterium]|nr:U32 family peptidase [Lachnospiraceae bacterium]
MTKPELLSPCGDYECFLAAIHAGCDAVYLGASFSARAYARNFTPEEILTAIDYAHLFSKKVYLTLNILMKDPEMDLIHDFLNPLYLAGLDGVIVQDIGLINYIHANFPQLPVHASTQMTITDAEGVLLLKEMGVSRVVLARELSLKEIRKIGEKTGVSLECFIHGALCYSYSGKCLMSSLIGGRSGNRGRCAQPCRLPYDGKYPLSCRDICTLKILPQLIDAGIASFKIEGRMKNPAYVAGVTGIYRKYIDRYLSDRTKPYQVDEEDFTILKTLYTRSGHTEGYYGIHNGPEMITMQKPGYAKADEQLEKETMDRFISKTPKLPLELSVTLLSGQPALLSAKSGAHAVTVEGDTVEAAKKRALLNEDIKKQLLKLGGTEFSCKKIDIDSPGNIFLPVSSINSLRREAVWALREEILKKGKRSKEIHGSFGIIHEEQKPYPPKPFLHASVSTMEQADALIHDPNVQILSVPVELFSSDAVLKAYRERIKTAPLKLFVIFPYICRDRYFQRHAHLITELLSGNEVAGVMIRNYESLYYLKQIAYTGEVLADLHLYAFNRYARYQLNDAGISITTVPVELNQKELRIRNASSEDLIVYGRLPLMISAQCLQKTLGKCDHSGRLCEIKDRYNVVFPHQSVCSECYSILYNSVPLSLHADTDLIRKLHPYSVRMIFTTEEGSMIGKMISDFSKALFDGIPFQPDYAYTRGHMQRGVE